ncbi:MAG TPA: glycoside hydrolase family 3 C-terminal domain-containing protein, partial [Halococcus sp.]|nr:glycoside hydrolase family 3 C-terminal domain-containing protein [Halococcus sp.]
ERALHELYLPSFRAAVEAGVGSVMTAYNRVNGTYMSEHRSLLRDVLKDEYEFDGFVVSDWWGTESTVNAASAGLDVEMPGDIDPYDDLPSEELPDDADPEDIEFPDILPSMDKGGLFGEPLHEAVEAGEIDEATIDEMVNRVLRTMERFGILDGDRTNGALDTPEHRRLARRIAIEGTVLLKNDGTLPLDDDAVALIGPNADTAKLGGGGSSEVSPFTQTSPLNGFRERAATVSFERGVPPITESSLFDAFTADDDTADEPDVSLEDAVAAAETADCAVVVVQDDTTEGTDRETLGLPGGQDELVEAVADAAERTVVVLRTSGPVTLPWVEDVNAVVETWYAGQADGDALAAVLYGDDDPGGRLPVTFGRRAVDYPTNTPERFPGDDVVEYDEGVFVGYRYFDREGIDPVFPFGHGLSYTSFEYGEPITERDEEQVVLTVPVHNTGERSGTEVVQVYVHEDETAVQRPDRELKGFAKIRLDAGERKRTSVVLDHDAFAHYDDGWTVSPGTFTLLVGRSSRDIRGEVTVEMS